MPFDKKTAKRIAKKYNLDCTIYYDAKQYIVNNLKTKYRTKIMTINKQGIVCSVSNLLNLEGDSLINEVEGYINYLLEKDKDYQVEKVIELEDYTFFIK